LDFLDQFPSDAYRYKNATYDRTRNTPNGMRSRNEHGSRSSNREESAKNVHVVPIFDDKANNDQYGCYKQPYLDAVE
jgi:hypothetical protein